MQRIFGGKVSQILPEMPGQFRENGKNCERIVKGLVSGPGLGYNGAAPGHHTPGGKGACAHV